MKQCTMNMFRLLTLTVDWASTLSNPKHWLENATGFWHKATAHGGV